MSSSLPGPYTEHMLVLNPNGTMLLDGSAGHWHVERKGRKTFVVGSTDRTPGGGDLQAVLGFQGEVRGASMWVPYYAGANTWTKQR